MEDKVEILQRPGKFRVSMELIHQDPDAIMALLSKVVVVRAETLFLESVIEFQGFSMLFSELDRYRTVPYYCFIVTRGVDGLYDVKLDSGSYCHIGTIEVRQEADWSD